MKYLKKFFLDREGEVNAAYNKSFGPWYSLWRKLFRYIRNAYFVNCSILFNRNFGENIENVIAFIWLKIIYPENYKQSEKKGD